MDQLVPFHLSKLHPDMSLRTCQQIPNTNCNIATCKTYSLLKIPRVQSIINKKSTTAWHYSSGEHTNFLPVKSAAAFTLPRRCMFDANWVVITLPLAAEICLNNESATTDSLVVLPGERIFVESLIICKVVHINC